MSRWVSSEGEDHERILAAVDDANAGKHPNESLREQQLAWSPPWASKARDHPTIRTDDKDLFAAVVEQREGAFGECNDTAALQPFDSGFNVRF